MISYDIYREDGRDWIIKDPKTSEIIYTMHCEYHVTKPNRRLLYRGPVHTGSCIAIIEQSGWSKNPMLKLYQTGEIISMENSGFLHKRRAFRYKDRDFVWSGDTKMTDTTGKVIALFDRKYFSWKKIGRLTIANDEIGMRDVIVATSVAVQSYWQEVGQKLANTKAGKHEVYANFGELE